MSCEFAITVKGIDGLLKHVTFRHTHVEMPRASAGRLHIASFPGSPDSTMQNGMGEPGIFCDVIT